MYNLPRKIYKFCSTGDRKINNNEMPAMENT